MSRPKLAVPKGIEPSRIDRQSIIIPVDHETVKHGAAQRNRTFYAPQGDRVTAGWTPSSTNCKTGGKRKSLTPILFRSHRVQAGSTHGVGAFQMAEDEASKPRPLSGRYRFRGGSTTLVTIFLKLCSNLDLYRPGVATNPHWRKASELNTIPEGTHRFPAEPQIVRVYFPKWRRAENTIPSLCTDPLV